jgi:hypothetical protein
MRKNGFVKRPKDAWRPKVFLGFAEKYAVRIGKICKQFDARGSPPRRPGATWHDAAALASLIRLLAKSGGARPAAEATEIAEYVELLLDLLRSEIT